MQFVRTILLCMALASLPYQALAEDGQQGCAGQAGCVPPVYVDPSQPTCDDGDCEPHTAITCEGENCMPAQENPVEACEGENCMPSGSGPLEDCEGQDCELAPPPE